MSLGAGSWRDPYIHAHSLEKQDDFLKQKSNTIIGSFSPQWGLEEVSHMGL
jgi:hypothetical protein